MEGIDKLMIDSMESELDTIVQATLRHACYFLPRYVYEWILLALRHDRAICSMFSGTDR